MGLQPYVHVDWRKIETVRKAMKKGSIITLSGMNARDPRHRKTLMDLTPAERAKLVTLDKKLANQVGVAANFLCYEKKVAEGIALYDLVARSPFKATDLDTVIGQSATYHLLVTATAEMKTRARAIHYRDYFLPAAPTCTPI